MLELSLQLCEYNLLRGMCLKRKKKKKKIQNNQKQNNEWFGDFVKYLTDFKRIVQLRIERCPMPFIFLFNSA